MVAGCVNSSCGSQGEGSVEIEQATCWIGWYSGQAEQTKFTLRLGVECRYVSSLEAEPGGESHEKVRGDLRTQ